MTYSIFRQVALTASLSLLASASFAMTLDAAVNQTLTTHPEVKAAEQNVLAISQEWRQAKAGYYPSVDLNAASGWEHSNNSTTRSRPSRGNGTGHRDMWRNESSLIVSQNLFDGFATEAETCHQAARYQSANAHLREVKETTALRTIQAYLDVLRNRELVSLAQNNLDNHKAYQSQVASRAESGRGSDADVRQAEGRVALAEADYVAARGELAKAEADFIEVVGSQPADLSAPEAPHSALPQTLTEAMDWAMKNHPALASAQQDIIAAEYAVKLADSSFYPHFKAEVGAARNHNLDGVDGANNEGLALVRMNYNLYNGGADTARKRERMERLQEAQQNMERDRRLVQQQMYKAWSDLATVRARLQPLSQHVLSSEQTRTAYKSQFDISQRSLLDLLDSEIETYNARVAMINARYAVDFAAFEVLADAGMLVNHLKTAR